MNPYLDALRMSSKFTVVGGGWVAEVTLWRVKGLDDQLFPNTLAAEVAARKAFPSESADARYARISFSRFVEDV